MQIVILNVKMGALLTLEPAPVLVQEAIQGNIVKVRVLQCIFVLCVCVSVEMIVCFREHCTVDMNLYVLVSCIY